MLNALMRSERPDESIWGDKLPKMQILGDVAVIPISGVLMLNAPAWLKEYGFNVTDPNDIEEEIAQALNLPQVEMIVFAVDSPGGESIAGEKLFDLTESANRKKPVFAYCGDGAMMCSSAYQACAPAVAIAAGKYADVGCVGTYMVYLDDSKYWEAMGLQWQTFRSGSLKGIDGALTDEQAAHFQASVDAYGSRFRAGVKKYRPTIEDADLEGQSFRGIEAAARGFVHILAKNETEAVNKFRKML